MAPDSFNDDQQCFLYEQYRDIVRGKSDETISSDHIQALVAQHQMETINVNLPETF